jgi:thioredoxin reductase (NADPH)
MQQFDLVVIGAGVAGLTAAMFGARYGLKTAVLTPMGTGGQIVSAERIENFPGFPQAIAGYELGPLLHEQAEAAGAEFLGDAVDGIDVADGQFIVRGASETLHTRSIIVAAGSSLRALGIPGEERLRGKGVSHCASCDGPFYAGRDVCVIGGGDSAVDEALVLARHAARVMVVHRGSAPDAQQKLLDQAIASGRIEIVRATIVEEILGDDTVAGVKLRDVGTGTIRVANVAGVFVYVGLEPNTAFVRDLVALDPSGHIETDIMMRTSRPGIFAAGDIRKNSVAQLAAAAGDGATAAISAFRHVKGRA